ncbi:hypothetical protein Goari_022967, partial [Gossypium aridum]|nr:hypothetical protein [Gossypium aridum]
MYAYYQVMSANPVIKSFDKVVLLMGSGCISPLKAMNPDLAYDISPEEYKRYLLSREGELEYLVLMEKTIEGEKILRMDLNFLNFRLVLDKASKYIINRTLTNVGCPKCSYKAKIWLYGKTNTLRIEEEVVEEFPEYIKISKEDNGITVSSPVVIFSTNLWK